MIKINLVDLIRDQNYAEEALYEAEHKQGLWGDEYSIDATKQELKEIEDDRLATIEHAKQRLRPRKLTDVHLPQIPMVMLDMTNMSENCEEYLGDLVPDRLYYCLGECAQAPGHVIILDSVTEKVSSGHHASRFIIVSVDNA